MSAEEDQRDRTRSPRRVPEDAVRHDWNQEPPDTTVPLPDDAEPTPLDGCSVADELDEDDAELVELAEVEELEAWPGEVEVPGMVAALTAVKTPSPANAAMAAPVVRRLSICNAASRARILAGVGLVFSMVGKLAVLF